MKNMSRCIGVVLACVIIFSFAGCSGGDKTGAAGSGQASEKPENEAAKTKAAIKIVDFAGREVELKQEAKRIVDLSQLDGVRALIQLGAQDRLVGMGDFGHQVFDPKGNTKDMYSIEPKAAPELKDIANVGSITEPNIQMILSLKPDIIFTKLNGKDFADSLQKQTKIPVACIGGYGEFNYDLYNIVGKIVGKEKRAEELIAFTKNRIKIVTDITGAIPEDEKKSIFYWSGAQIGDDPSTVGHYDAFDLAGAKNVGKNPNVLINYKLKKEQILEWDPDFIIKGTFFMDKEKEGWHTIETIKQDPVLKATKAVKNNNVYPTRGTMFGWDISTEITEVFYIAKLLYPDKFADLDVEKHGNEILKEFYGIDGLYTDMSNRLRLYEWK